MVEDCMAMQEHIKNIFWISGYRTPADLFDELVQEGIIIRYPKTPLSEYIGEYSYLGTTLRQANLEPMPSISDVRRLVSEYCILPLGTFSIMFYFWLYS